MGAVMGIIPRPRCSLCKDVALVTKIRSPLGRIVTAIFCPRCDKETKR